MKFVKKNWIKIIVAILALVIFVKIYSHYTQEAPIAEELAPVAVETFALGDFANGGINTFCSVDAVSDVDVISQASAKVTSVSIKDGDTVRAGQKIAQLESIQERVSVQNAKVSLSSAKLALSELLEKNDPSSAGSVANQTKLQQEALVENARNAYFNTDLRAYPEELDETSSAPIISGNYTCSSEGSYLIDVYGSSSDTGASFRYSGLESGRASVSVDYAVPFGDCGLEIVFPKDFKKDKEWIISLPNTRSASYFSLKNSYESAKSGKSITLDNSIASPERIAQERARVAQAQLQLESAYDQLSKKSITAPSSGIVSGFSLTKGSFVSNGSRIANIKSVGELELVAYINPDDKNRISESSLVTIGGIETGVDFVSGVVDSLNKKVKVLIDAPEGLDLIEGTQNSCSISYDIEPDLESNDFIIVPLSAVSIIGDQSYVFTVNDSIVSKHLVETASLLGDKISIKTDVSGDLVVDARGIRDGETVMIK